MTVLVVEPFTPWTAGRGRQAKDTSILTFAKLSWQRAWDLGSRPADFGRASEAQCILKLLNEKEKPLTRPRTNLFPGIKHFILKTEPLRSEYMYLWQEYRPTAPLTMKTRKSSSFFYWHWSLWRSPWWGLFFKWLTHKSCGFWSPSCAFRTGVWRKGLLGESLHWIWV